MRLLQDALAAGLEVDVVDVQDAFARDDEDLRRRAEQCKRRHSTTSYAAELNEPKDVNKLKWR